MFIFSELSFDLVITFVFIFVFVLREVFDGIEIRNLDPWILVRIPQRIYFMRQCVVCLDIYLLLVFVT